MNISEYISSGTLELYVTGALSATEAAEVERMMKDHPEVAREIGFIEDSLAQVAMATSRKPRRNLLADIHKQIDDQQEAIIRTLPVAAARNNTLQYFAAACVALLLVSNMFFAVKWRDAENKLSGIIAQNFKLAQNYELIKTTYERTKSDLAVTTSPQYKVLSMKGLPIAPAAEADIYWNGESRETYLLVKNLPQPEADKQYQLWAIVDGKPVDAGVFDVSDQKGILLKMKDIGNAQAFAVTLEPRGGSVNPTMDQMYVIAKI